MSGPKFALLRNALVDRHRLEGVEHIECGELLEYITNFLATIILNRFLLLSAYLQFWAGSGVPGKYLACPNNGLGKSLSTVSVECPVDTAM